MKKILLAGLSLCMFAACSKKNSEITKDESGNGAYMSLSVAMPSATGSKALTGGDGTEAGTEAEQKVTGLLVLVYNSDGTINTAESFTAAQLSPAGPNNPSISDNSTVYTTPDFQITGKGGKKLAVIVNPGAKFTETSSLASLRAAMTLTESEVDGISAANNFLMTNANTTVNQAQNGNDNTDGALTTGMFCMDGSVYVEVQGTKENPTSVIVPVERAVAKIVDVTANYELAVGDGSTGDKVIFSQVALINGNTKFFPIKSIRASGAAGNDYVVDPNFTNTADYVNDFYARAFSPVSGVTWWKTLSTAEADRPVIYTLENTMAQDAQMTGFTTGLYYKATYVRKGNTSTAGHVYRYLGTVYSFDELSAAVAAGTLSLPLGALTDASPVADFKAIGVDKYENGVCYYPYWIRHVNNNQADDMGVMEFGVVRNNVYKMEIHSVKGIGAVTPVDPDPQVPDEDGNATLQVLVKVLPWTVRNNQIEF